MDKEKVYSVVVQARCAECRTASKERIFITDKSTLLGLTERFGKTIIKCHHPACGELILLGDGDSFAGLLLWTLKEVH